MIGQIINMIGQYAELWLVNGQYHSYDWSIFVDMIGHNHTYDWSISLAKFVQWLVNILSFDWSIFSAMIGQ